MLSPDEIKLLNPNTMNCPIFRNERDAEITKQVYHRVPILISKNERNDNLWGCKLSSMFHMTNDSHLFKTKIKLDELGFELVGNQYIKGEETFLPIYESKMFWQFDHRFGTFEGFDNRTNTHLVTPKQEEYLDPTYTVEPWYWISSEHVNKQVSVETKWIIAFRDVARATDERTGIFTIYPG